MPGMSQGAGSAMAELEKTQSLLMEMSQRLRELETKLMGGTTQ